MGVIPRVAAAKGSSHRQSLARLGGAATRPRSAPSLRLSPSSGSVGPVGLQNSPKFKFSGGPTPGPVPFKIP